MLRTNTLAPKNVARLARLPGLALAGLVAAAPVVVGSAARAEDTPRIVGGHLESRWPAIGALLSDGEWFCSGTAIAPRIILTAAHCLDGIPGTIEFFMGADANQPNAGRRVRATSIHPHPTYTSDDRYDVGIVVLDQDVAVETLPARLTPMDASIIGRQATFVGYGLTVQGGDGGEKRSVDIAIGELNDFFLGFNSTEKNTCNGDSGGPALMDLGRGLEVIGVTSYGDAGCVENSYNTRTDVFADWIQAFLDGNIPETPPVTGGGDDDDVTGGDDGATSGDICADLGWYNDDFCDEDCAKPDPDCDGSDDGGDDWTDDGGDDWTDDGGDDWTDDGGNDNGNNDDDGAPTTPTTPTTPTSPDGDVQSGLDGCTGGSAPLGLGAALAALALLTWRRTRRV